jgi:hypothetical protein
MPKTKFYAYNPETGRDKRIKRQKTAPIGVSDNPTQYQFSAYNPSTGRSKKIREPAVKKARAPRAPKAPRDPNAPKKPRGPRKYGPNNRPEYSPSLRVKYTYTADGIRTSHKNEDYITEKKANRMHEVQQNKDYRRAMAENRREGKAFESQQNRAMKKALTENRHAGYKSGALTKPPPKPRKKRTPYPMRVNG